MLKEFSGKTITGGADDKYKSNIFNVLNMLLTAVSGVMAAVNCATGEYGLAIAAGAFAVLCLGNYLSVKAGFVRADISAIVFSAEAMLLVVFFIVSGRPEGFSVLWTLLVPAISMYALGQKPGIVFSTVTLLTIIFFFWLPCGRELLRYGYSETFMLRFPIVYICLFAAAAYTDVILAGIYDKLKETEESARYLYRHDALTGIYSRHAFYEELEKILGETSGTPVSLAMLDIDGFKGINDKYGHNAGDEVLKETACVISENVCEHSIVCRWGGEEFVVVSRCGHDSYLMCEEIRKTIENTAVLYHNTELYVTVSVGIAVAENVNEAQLSDFINCADTAMYFSKKAGKNRTTVKKYNAEENLKILEKKT